MSGALLFARTDKAASRLAAAFRERRVEKDYAAVVEPADYAEAFDGDDGWFRLDGWLRPGRDGVNSRVFAEERPDAKRADLLFRFRARWTAPDGRARAWVAVRPRTGLKHQIRAQLAAAGLPIVGDFRYGPRGRPARPAPFLDGRGVALHARRLAFKHPTRDETVVVVAPWPPALAALAAPGGGVPDDEP